MPWSLQVPWHVHQLNVLSSLTLSWSSSSRHEYCSRYDVHLCISWSGQQEFQVMHDLPWMKKNRDAQIYYPSLGTYKSCPATWNFRWSLMKHQTLPRIELNLHQQNAFLKVMPINIFSSCNCLFDDFTHFVYLTHFVFLNYLLMISHHFLFSFLIFMLVCLKTYNEHDV